MRKYSVAAAALLGMSAGMRMFMPLGALGLALPRRRMARVPFALAALNELVYDQLPWAQDRTRPASLAGRLVSGGVAGGVAGRAGARTALGAATGALAALASTFLFHRLRAATAARVSPRIAAVGEDLLAIGAAAAGTRIGVV